MLKIGKMELVNKFKAELDKSHVVLVLGHTKLQFSAFDNARREATPGTKIKMVKNNLAKIAFEHDNYKSLRDDLKDQRLLVLSDDLFKACQSIKFFMQENKGKIEVIKGASKDGVYEAATILALTQISSVEELQSKMLRAIKVVGENLLRVIKAKFDTNE